MKTPITREDLIQRLIVAWAKLPYKYCLTCGKPFRGDKFCCDDPLIVNNAGSLKHNYEMLQVKKAMQKNKFGSTTDKSFRALFSFPPGLMGWLQKKFKQQTASPDNPEGEELFNKDYPPTWFARHFGKYFQIPEEL